ncbi:MAG: ATP-binding protein [Clostridia bacterium]|nr:ATP-binding protein [Clostridia bacterium]
MPRLTISGSHSTGKSTVMNALKEIPALSKRFTFKSEILRDIKKTGIKINEYGTDETQLLVLSKMVEYSTIPNTILDRCVLDCLAYTAYLYEKGQVKKSTLKIAETLFENIRYDIYFYITPEFSIVPDGTRSENLEFRNRVAEIFEEYMESYSLNPIRLTGNIEQRVNQFVDAVNMYDKWIKEEKKEKDNFMMSLQQKGS